MKTVENTKPERKTAPPMAKKYDETSLRVHCYCIFVHEWRKQKLFEWKKGKIATHSNLLG